MELETFKTWLIGRIILAIRDQAVNIEEILSETDNMVNTIKPKEDEYVKSVKEFIKKWQNRFR